MGSREDTSPSYSPEGLPLVFIQTHNGFGLVELEAEMRLVQITILHLASHTYAIIPPLLHNQTDTIFKPNFVTYFWSSSHTQQVELITQRIEGGRHSTKKMAEEIQRVT
jgi:hypothetical protein